MTDIATLLERHDQQTAALARTETELRKAERAYWAERGCFLATPRRERLRVALAEDARALTPIEAYLEGMPK